ncbi:MAG: PDZ domain-containing protein, partial [Vicinamibacterales bacterium]
RGSSPRLVAPPAIGSPAYRAGLDIDDELRAVDGQPVRSPVDVSNALARRVPGDRIVLAVVDRAGSSRSITVVAEDDPALELVMLERSGGTLTPEQRAFRSAWLN